MNKEKKKISTVSFIFMFVLMLLNVMSISPAYAAIKEVPIHTYSQNTWANSTLAKSPSGDIYLAHKINYTQIAIKQWNGSNWVSLPSITSALSGDSGYNDSLNLAVDSEGKLHLAFTHYIGSGSSSHRGVKYGVFNGTSWSFKEIEAYSHPSGFRNFRDPVLDVDSTGAVHMAYKYSDAGIRKDYIKYATNKSGSWVIQTIAIGDTSGGIDELHDPSIAVDGNDAVHLSYVKEDFQNNYYGNYYYTKKEAAEASFPASEKLVDSITEQRDYVFTPLVVDESGKLHFTYTETIMDWNNYVIVSSISYYQTNASGSWKREQVASGDTVSVSSPVGVQVVDSNVYMLMDSMGSDWSNQHFSAMANYGNGWITGTAEVFSSLMYPYMDELTYLVDSNGDFMLVMEHGDLRNISSLTGTSEDFGLIVVKPTFTVTYDGNGNTGGSVPVDGNKYEEGNSATVLGNTGNLVKTGYKFTGWNTKSDGSGTTYPADDVITMGASNITLYAQWIPLSNNANLSNLTVGSGTLTPAFDSNTTPYSLTVPFTVTSLPITPTADDAYASISVNGSAAISGNPSSVPLQIGTQPITINVTAEDGTTTKTYEINVNREKAITQTSLTSSNPEANAGEVLNFHIKVQPIEGNSIPTGNVVLKDGQQQLAILPLNEAGEADFSTSLLSIGDHSITAEYSGDSNHAPSTAAELQQKIYAVLEAYQVTGAAGGSVSLPILMSSSGNIAGLQFDLLYDSNNLSFRHLTEGSLFDERMHADFVELSPGKLRVILANLENAEIPSGTGQLMSLTFQISESAANKAKSPIAFADPTFVDDQGRKLTSDFHLLDGSVTVIDDQAPTIKWSASPEGPTNESVTITLNTSGTGSDITVMKWAKGNLSLDDFGSQGISLDGQTFDVFENETYTVFAEDTAGNQSVQTIYIGNIDRELPVLSIQGLIPNPDPLSASITVSVNSDGTGSNIVESKYGVGFLTKQELRDNGESFGDQVVLTKNQPYSFYLRDAAGNETLYTFSFMGDTNFNQVTDVTDWVQVINYILERKVPTATQKMIADMNSDQTLNVADPVILANIIMNGYPGANHTPTLENDIPLQVVDLDQGSLTLDIASNFADQDGDTLQFSAASTGGTSIRVQNGQLIITPTVPGESTVTVKAYDGRGGTATASFTIIVNPSIVTPPPITNQQPVVAQPILDQTMIMTEGPVTLGLGTLFTDADQDPLVLSVESSDPAIVQASIEGTQLMLNPLQAGVTTITVRADDQQAGTAQFTFSVDVRNQVEENLAPIVAQVPNGQMLTLGKPVGIDLAAVFEDPDQDSLTFSVNILHGEIVAPQLEGTVLTLTPLAEGNTIIEVTADDSKGGTTKTNFTATVEPAPINHAPAVNEPIPSPQTMYVGQDQLSFELNDHFSDEDGDSLTFTSSSSDSTVATASVDGTTLYLDALAAGTVTITVTADDENGGTSSITFELLIMLNI